MTKTFDDLQQDAYAEVVRVMHKDTHGLRWVPADHIDEDAFVLEAVETPRRVVQLV